MFLHGWKEEVVRIGRDTTAQERNEAEGRKAITATGMESPQVGIVGRLALMAGRAGQRPAGTDRSNGGGDGQQQDGNVWHTGKALALHLLCLMVGGRQQKRKGIYVWDDLFAVI